MDSFIFYYNFKYYELLPFGKQASRSSCNSKAFTVLCSSASCRKTASYCEKPLPSRGGALMIVDFTRDGGVSRSLIKSLYV